MKERVKKFFEDRKEAIVKASVCVTAGALIGAQLYKKYGGEKILGISAMIDPDEKLHVQVAKRNGSAEFWSGNPTKTG